jgi:hypothetical protein
MDGDGVIGAARDAARNAAGEPVDVRTANRLSGGRRDRRPNDGRADLRR